MRTMRTFTLPLCGLLLTATLASAQPQPQKQPPRPAQPQDPTPVPIPLPQPAGGLKPDPTSKDSAPAGRVPKSDSKITGCLQRAEEPAGPATEQGRLVGGYILKQASTTQATESPAGARGERKASGTKEYRVVAGSDSVKLAEHVGHQVEMTGRITLDGQTPNPSATEEATSTSRPSGSTGVSTVPSTGSPGAGPQVTFTVTSLKTVASTCTTATN